MTCFEFTGKTPEDAIKIACRKLNLTEDEIDIEVVEPGSSGIFGLVGGKKARIKVKEKVKEKKGEKKQPSEDHNQDELDVAAIAKDALENILRLMPLENLVVKDEEKEGAVFLKIEGDKTGLLIGRKGQTLDALQFIVNKIVNKALGKRANVVVDSENYRERRQDFLVQTAIKLGEKAKKTMRPVSTDLLNPKDRRTVHMTLRNDKELETRSKGDGHLKKVVIFPNRNIKNKPA